MNAWFDLKQLGASAARDPSLEDKKGYMESVDKIMALIELLVEEEKIPAKNIILGGFSQGASITLSTALLLKYKIGGVMVCSGFVRAEDEVSKRLSQLGQAPANSLTPVFQSHGVYDDVINIKEGEYANQFLKKCGFDDIKFEKYGFQHTLPPLQDMYDFMVKVLA